MGIAAKLSEPADLRKSSLQIAEEAVDHASIVGDGIAAKSQCQCLDMGFENLFEAAFGLTHKTCEEPKGVRLATAQVYSRQTSCGASWT